LHGSFHDIAESDSNDAAIVCKLEKQVEYHWKEIARTAKDHQAGRKARVAAA